MGELRYVVKELVQKGQEMSPPYFLCSPRRIRQSVLSLEHCWEKIPF